MGLKPPRLTPNAARSGGLFTSRFMPGGRPLSLPEFVAIKVIKTVFSELEDIY